MWSWRRAKSEMVCYGGVAVLYPAERINKQIYAAEVIFKS
jgi:hypothetical protein